MTELQISPCTYCCFPSVPLYQQSKGLVVSASYRKCNILRATEVDQYDVVDRAFFSEHYSLSPSVTISPNILSSTIDAMVLVTNSFAKQNTKNLRDFSTDE